MEGSPKGGFAWTRPVNAEHPFNPLSLARTTPRDPCVCKGPGEWNLLVSPGEKEMMCRAHSVVSVEDRMDSEGRTVLGGRSQISALEAPRLLGTECPQPSKFLAFSCLDWERHGAAF